VMESVVEGRVDRKGRPYVVTVVTEKLVQTGSNQMGSICKRCCGCGVENVLEGLGA
jgi:hypothetical protein